MENSNLIEYGLLSICKTSNMSATWVKLEAYLVIIFCIKLQYKRRNGLYRLWFIKESWIPLYLRGELKGTPLILFHAQISVPVDYLVFFCQFYLPLCRYTMEVVITILQLRFSCFFELKIPLKITEYSVKDTSVVPYNLFSPIVINTFPCN